MNRINPPSWMEHLLRRFLPPADRETIAGDLREEFHDRAATRGAGSAKLWYLRQIISFMPRGLAFAFGTHIPLPLLCGFTGLCALWLGAMDLRLHHSASQMAIAGSILGQSLVTLAALLVRFAWLRYLSVAGCAGMLFLAGKALLGLIHGYHFEGYILLIALLLVVQSCFTIFTMPWLRAPRGKSA